MLLKVQKSSRKKDYFRIEAAIYNRSTAPIGEADYLPGHWFPGQKLLPTQICQWI